MKSLASDIGMTQPFILPSFAWNFGFRNDFDSDMALFMLTLPCVLVKTKLSSEK